MYKNVEQWLADKQFCSRKKCSDRANCSECAFIEGQKSMADKILNLIDAHYTMCDVTKRLIKFLELHSQDQQE